MISGKGMRASGWETLQAAPPDMPVILTAHGSAGRLPASGQRRTMAAYLSLMGIPVDGIAGWT
jgi:hypothetical protein